MLDLNIPRYIATSIMLVTLTSGCVNSGGSTESLAKVQQIKGKFVRQTQQSAKHFREDAIKEAAISTGAQSGLAWRTKQLNASLTKYAKILDRVFNFQQMLLSDNVLCPVLIESEGNFNINDDKNSLRIADKEYLILKQAMFVTAAPNWREFLWYTHTPPNIPENALLPITRSERKIWKEASTKGWEHGVKQADNIFKESLYRLKQDFQGMILYRSLLAQDMISAPQIAKTSLGVTGDDREVRVNDQILRIAEKPKLQLDANFWKPIVRQ